MITLTGKKVSEGIAIGKLTFYRRDIKEVKRIYVKEIEKEVSRFQKAKESQLFTTQEFVQIAKKAVCERYHLTAQQASSMTIDVDENSAYVMLDGTLCYRCWIFVGEFSSENTEQEGTYTVYVNLETGVVEDIQFLSEQGGGNG